VMCGIEHPVQRCMRMLQHTKRIARTCTKTIYNWGVCLFEMPGDRQWRHGLGNTAPLGLDRLSVCLCVLVIQSFCLMPLLSTSG
jgi:hypothetical protein